MKIFRKIFDYFSSTSLQNIDKTISFYLNEIHKNNLNISHFSSLQNSINSTSDPIVMHKLKIELKNKLQRMIIDHDFEIYKDTFDKAW